MYTLCNKILWFTYSVDSLTLSNNKLTIHDCGGALLKARNPNAVSTSSVQTTTTQTDVDSEKLEPSVGTFIVVMTFTQI